MTNVRSLHAHQHGYVPEPPLYYGQGPNGELPPPGYAFNQFGEVVQLPYEPWAQGPQMGWEDPANPAYLEYAQGRMTIESQPSADPRLPARYTKAQDGAVGHVAPVTNEDVTLVPQSAYLDRDGDRLPQQDEGTGSIAVMDMPASIARTRYKISHEILGLVQVDAPLAGDGSPLTVIPVGSSETPATPFFGGAVALGVCQFGHLGTQSRLVFDILPGALVKIPTVDSFMRITGRMSPRYFATLDTGVSPNIIRTYLLFPGGPALTNDSFSELPPNIMELQGSGPGTVIAAGDAANPIKYSGWCGMGVSTIPDQATLPVRIFRGSVPSSAASPAAFSNRARIPIPHNAKSMTLVGGFYNPADTPASVGLIWTQNLDVTNAVVGPFALDPDGAIPIVQGATSIDVFGGNSAMVGSIEIPFMAIYYLNC